MWPFRHALPSRLPTFPVLVVLTLVLSVGVAGCDSAGTSTESENENNDGGVDIAETFQVTVESIEGTDYQYADQNQNGVAFAIGGEVGREITLEQGKTYAFALGESVAEGPNGTSHPFYIGQTEEGQGSDPYSNGVENENATSGTVTFAVPSDAPSSLYYQCGAHVYMGGDISITASSGGGDSGEDY